MKIRAWPFGLPFVEGVQEEEKQLPFGESPLALEQTRKGTLKCDGYLGFHEFGGG